MKKLITAAVVIMTLGVCAPTGLAGQIIGQLSDPCNPAIYDYVDILSAWVERDGTNLVFVMEMRGDIPEAAELPDYNDSVTYIWLVDADNYPSTGQSPGNVGSEFNVRAVIGQNPIFAGGYVDIVGAMQDAGTGGTGIVAVDGNRISMTISRSQIASPRRFHWRSDAWAYIGGVVTSNNGLMESGLARASRYGVLPIPENDHFQVGDNTVRAFLETDPENPVIDITINNGGNFFVCLPVERKWPDQDNTQIDAQATGHAGPHHLRMASRFDLFEGDSAADGIAEGVAMFDGDFLLDGDPGETGPVPPGVFLLKFTHDYHLFASDMAGQGYCYSFAQIVINQVDPLEQKGVWLHQDRMQNEQRFGKYSQTIDLADYGLLFGVGYKISNLLTDRSEMPAWSDAGSIFSDSTMLTSIDVAPIRGDEDGDWDVDLFDFAALAENWLVAW